MNDWHIVEARGAADYAVARALFEEYAGQLPVDLAFQDFATELTRLPTLYGPPDGCLLLLQSGAAWHGCGALRRLETRVCEMKRLYVRPGARGARLGRTLALALIAKAAALGYECMRLDTLAGMTAAIRLYRSLGFRPIAAYYANPVPDSLYLELTLNEAAAGAGR